MQTFRWIVRSQFLFVPLAIPALVWSRNPGIVRISFDAAPLSIPLAGLIALTWSLWAKDADRRKRIALACLGVLELGGFVLGWILMISAWRVP